MADTAINNLSSALSSLQASSRKPDLPTFDSANIDKWIKRVESAYIRSGVTRPQEKFAFVEGKIGVDLDPTIDEFLFGDSTEEQWVAFCAYLRKRYGPTDRQRAAAVLEPIKRDDRIPSNYFSKLNETIGNITLDEVIKEICIRSLPNDIQQTICKATESMSAKDTMAYADSFFSNDGSRLHKAPAPVHHVQQGPTQAPQEQQQQQFLSESRGSFPGSFTAPFGGNNDNWIAQSNVNEVNDRGRTHDRGGNNNNNRLRSNNRGRFNNNYNNGRNLASGNPMMCFYHEQYGTRARNCTQPCAWKDKSGNGQGHRRQ